LFTFGTFLEHSGAPVKVGAGGGQPPLRQDKQSPQKKKEKKKELSGVFAGHRGGGIVMNVEFLLLVIVVWKVLLRKPPGWGKTLLCTHKDPFLNGGGGGRTGAGRHYNNTIPFCEIGIRIERSKKNKRIALYKKDYRKARRRGTGSGSPTSCCASKNLKLA